MEPIFRGAIHMPSHWPIGAEIERTNQQFYIQEIHKQEMNRSSEEHSDTLNASHSSLGENETINEKPPMSYVALITMAIKSSKEGRLTLSDIYDYLIKNFQFFRTTRSRGWMNAVRHNLTLNDCFVKLPRDPLMRGKGSYWCIDPESKGMFNHGSLKRRRTRYKRVREEIEVVKDIMNKSCTVTTNVQYRHPQVIYAPYFLNRSSTPKKLGHSEPKRKCSNFSIDAILGNDSSKNPPKARPILKLYSTEVWQC